jgi:hypothetical protein
VPLVFNFFAVNSLLFKPTNILLVVFVDKDIKIKVIHHEFVKEHVSFFVIEYGNIKCLIIGVYMPFDNNKIDSFCAFETNLALISELINHYKRMKNCNILLVGDFNADFGRSKRFDKCLIVKN